MKKIVFLLLCTTLLLSACGNAETVSETPSEMPSEVSRIISAAANIEKTNQTADILKDKMEKLTDSEEYLHSERNHQYQMALEFVENLKSEGLIEEEQVYVGDAVSFTFGENGWGGFNFYNSDSNLASGHAPANEMIDALLENKKNSLKFQNYLEAETSIAFAYLGVGTDPKDITDDDKMNLAEEKTKNFLESDDYKNADKDKKVEMALQFVDELQKEGLIQHYDYFENNELISYTHLNGTLGGISFHDFNETIDSLAMNGVDE